MIPTLLSALLLLSAGACAAEWSEHYSRATLFFNFANWEESLDTFDQTLGQSVFGLSWQHVAGDKLELGLWSTLSNNSFEGVTGDDISISSLNDTRASGTYYFADRNFSASMSINLPTGKTELEDDEFPILVGLTDNSKRFTVRRLGQGLNVGGELLARPQVEEWRLLAGAGYLYRGGYRVLASSDADYKFGNEIYGRVGVERDPLPVGFEAGLELRTYGKDEFDGDEVYQSGSTIGATASLRYREEWSGAVGVRLLMRSKARIASATNGALNEEAYKSGRDELQFFGAASTPVAEKAQLLGRFEYKNVSANEYDETDPLFRSSANYLGLSARGAYQFSLFVSGSILAGYYFGTVGDDNDLTGINIIAALTFRYW
jgi:hypothetical protein